MKSLRLMLLLAVTMLTVGASAKIEKLDEVLFKYINDYAFRTQVKSDIVKIKVKKEANILETIVNAILNIFESYENIRTRKIQVTRWI